MHLSFAPVAAPPGSPRGPRRSPPRSLCPSASGWRARRSPRRRSFATLRALLAVPAPGEHVRARLQVRRDLHGIQDGPLPDALPVPAVRRSVTRRKRIRKLRRVGTKPRRFARFAPRARRVAVDLQIPLRRSPGRAWAAAAPRTGRMRWRTRGTSARARAPTGVLGRRRRAGDDVSAIGRRRRAPPSAARREHRRGTPRTISGTRSKREVGLSGNTTR